MNCGCEMDPTLQYKAVDKTNQPEMQASAERFRPQAFLQSLIQLPSGYAKRSSYMRKVHSQSCARPTSAGAAMRGIIQLEASGA
jgi:hypothetical protein